MKKLTSVILACVMVMALMIPAFASSQTVSATGVTAAPTIKVTMPKAINIALNPYKMAYNSTKLNLSEPNTSTFICPVVSMKNESNVALDMAIKGNAVKAGEIKVLGADGTVVTETPGDKNVQISLVVLADQESDLSAVTLGITATGKKTAVMTDKAADLFGGTVADSSAAIRLASCAGNDGTTITPTYTYFNFVGSCNTNPKNAYTTSDTVGASLTFTFTPVAASGS